MMKHIEHSTHIYQSQCCEHCTICWTKCAVTGRPIECAMFFVTDNGRNISAAVKRLPWTERACFAHALQLVINDARSRSPAIDRLCKKVRHVVGHYKHSSSTQKRLEGFQKKMGKDTPRLVQNVETRWNSQYCLAFLNSKKQSLWSLLSWTLTSMDSFHQSGKMLLNMYKH